MLGMLSIIAGISFLGINIIYHSLKRNFTEIQIERGDTLPIIAEFYNCKTEDLIYLNKLKRPYKLVTGQRLKVISDQPDTRVIKNTQLIQSANSVKVASLTILPESLILVRESCKIPLHWPFYKLSFREISAIGSLADIHWMRLSVPIRKLKSRDNEIHAPFAGAIHNMIVNNSNRVVLCSENHRLKLVLDDVDKALAADGSIVISGQKIARWKRKDNKWRIFIHFTQDGRPKDFLRVLCKKYIKLK